MLSQQFGAWIAAAITALQITLNSVGMPAQQISNFLSDPFNVVYTYQESQLDQYFDQSKIQILPGNTIIDGVVYDDVWLSDSASEIFRVNAFDFTSAYSIASNTNGTYVSGAGTSFGLPFYQKGNYYFTVNYSFNHNGLANTYSLGDLTLQFQPITGLYYGNCNVYRSGNLIATSRYRSDQNTSILDIRYTPGALKYKVEIDGYSSGQFDGDLLDDPFEFDYTAGTIPVDTPLESDEGLLMHIPHHSGTSHLQQFIDDNPEFVEPGGIEIDPSIDPDIHTKLGDLINIIAPLIPVIKAEFATAPVAPVSDDTIADTLFSELSTILNNIIQTIASIPTAISALGDRILEDIELGPIRVFQKVLDLFRTIFAPVINLITAGIGIWSYVVSWLSAISLPFNFVLSVVPSGIMIPIYAGVAGWLVIAIFRRFGR